VNHQPFCASWLVTAACVFAQANAPLYAVGGVVRNALMGLPASDIDLCGPARPEEVARFCEGTAIRAELRAAHFGTVELHIADETGRHMAEYTTFRTDSYRCGHRPDAVRFADSPEVDALRRDFSVNALYRFLPQDPDTPTTVLDPTGGLNHLKQGVLHTVTENPDHVFQDDGLRILRAARFQAELGLTPTETLLASAAKYAALLNDIACERLRDELARLLLSDLKYPTLLRTRPPVTAGLKTLQTVGAWPYLFGSLCADEYAIQALAFYHSPEGLPPLAGKMALLFINEQPDALDAQMRRLRFSTREVLATRQALEWTHTLMDGNATTMGALCAGRAAAEHAASAFSALEVSDASPGKAAERARVLSAVFQNDLLPKSLQALAVRGNDLLPLCKRYSLPQDVVGQTLNTLWRAVVEAGVPNEREALIARATLLMENEAKREQ
jgi:hypothetical protein